jgi:hypothetical protein
VLSNFNDGFGGGNLVQHNLIFNQCRETGDHGPINSWDRQPFITDVATGKPSYDAAMSNITGNYIWANYGSSQGFDTDDGSSWYNISDNFMWQADGYKMDFGGHDTVITNNLFWKDGGDGQNCINSWAFLHGHGTTYTGNKCFLPHTMHMGHVSGGMCPGGKVEDDWWSSVTRNSPGLRLQAPPPTPPPEPGSICGVEFGDNSYYSTGMAGGFPANLTMNTGGDKDITWYAKHRAKHPRNTPRKSTTPFGRQFGRHAAPRKAPLSLFRLARARCAHAAAAHAAGAAVS